MIKSSAINMVLGWNSEKVGRYIHRGCGRRRSKWKWIVVPFLPVSTMK
jgi:hypothetical protein